MKAPRDITFYATGQNLMWDLHPCLDCNAKGEVYCEPRYTSYGFYRGGTEICGVCEGKGYLNHYTLKRRFTRKVANG